MKYSELMLLEENIIDYLVECYINDGDNEPVEESKSGKPNLKKDVDKLFKNKEKRYLHSDVISGYEGGIRSASEKATEDKKQYQFSKLMSKLSGALIVIGGSTGAAGLLTDNNVITALGNAVGISGIISKIRFSEDHIAKKGRRYESDLLSLSEKLEQMKKDLNKADDEMYRVQDKLGIDKSKTKKSISKKEVYRQIDKIQRNIDKARSSIIADDGKNDFTYND